MSNTAFRNKVFIREWEQQVKGSRRAYFIPYTLVWAFILAMFWIVTDKMISKMIPGLAHFLWIPFCLVGGVLVTTATYYRNHSRYLELTRKESPGQPESDPAPPEPS
ncbi:MAG TPA: hypothetical protein VHK69_18750 [Chitinophagaceae bacterium]|jgi:hypothetical protein|nr:hypothetical protein [Chitinophagaceae bacterium]